MAASIPLQKTSLYQKYQKEVEEYKELKRETGVKYEKRTRLDTTKNENVMMMDELARLEDDAVVYKKSGPVLVKIELEEARSDVGNKIRIIEDQIKQIDTQIKNIQSKIENKESKLSSMQQELQKQIAMTQSNMKA
eukprot:CAMPEP_0202708452 /NCGR_PEP_ID=MMETSP1385-20130828/20663_1 /ASSEMBLY_ACC=CAM_ASM_000861 /TAXON_ID=933848 /ORGANISM="Elphidium margaritaceum" /LENGTH=135 /DNA_ID=CAMNT_0049367427 /DNA_START=22 /DNA_END=429 /DNA_ORIENTATION=-